MWSIIRKGSTENTINSSPIRKCYGHTGQKKTKESSFLAAEMDNAASKAAGAVSMMRILNAKKTKTAIQTVEAYLMVGQEDKEQEQKKTNKRTMHSESAPLLTTFKSR
jgi:hypothetical protein